MQLFQNILASLNNKFIVQQGIKSSITDVINTTIGTGLTDDQVTLKQGVLIITAAPTIKLTLKLKERLVCEALQEKGFIVISIR